VESSETERRQVLEPQPAAYPVIEFEEGLRFSQIGPVRPIVENEEGSIGEPILDEFETGHGRLIDIAIDPRERNIF
jgi:hypothetical protein